MHDDIGGCAALRCAALVLVLCCGPSAQHLTNQTHVSRPINPPSPTHPPIHPLSDNMEFQRQGGGVISGSVRTFDLVIRLKNNPQVNEPPALLRSFTLLPIPLPLLLLSP